MSVTLSVRPRVFSKQLVASAARKNNATQVLNSLTIGNKPFKKKFEELKKEMIKEFLNLPITKEILRGPGASNISGTLGGYGNLFSFIGFPAGSNPIDPIVKLLNQTTLNVGRITTRGTLDITVTLPGKNDIFAVTPMPWATGLSWAQRMEVGLAGYGEYLNTDSPKSRSSKGVQSESNIRAGGFSNRPYISSFLNKWKDRFLKME